MTYLVTIDSVRDMLISQGSTCPLESCRSEDFRVTFQGSSQDDCGREHFTCNSCSTEWSVYLYPAKVESIMLPNGIRYEAWQALQPQTQPDIELGALSQMACPTGPIIEVLNEFLLQMKRGSVRGKGEALAKLAFLARMDITPLPGTPPAELPELPFGTE